LPAVFTGRASSPGPTGVASAPLRVPGAPVPLWRLLAPAALRQRPGARWPVPAPLRTPATRAPG